MVQVFVTAGAGGNALTRDARSRRRRNKPSAAHSSGTSRLAASLGAQLRGNMTMGESDGGRDIGDGVPVAELPEGAVVGGCIDGEAVVLVNAAGRICALAGTCTHLQAPMADALLVDGVLICPWHHARFRVDTGEAIGAPAFDPLTVFVVEERDGRLFVTGRAPEPGRDETPPPPRVVIVGGGAAGHACAELLVRSGHRGAVTMVSDDADPPCDRTMLSKQYLIGQMPRADVMLAAPGFYGANGPVLHLRRHATAIDVAARELVLDGGERLPFDALVLATGAEPKRLDRPGFDAPCVYLLRSLADADALIAAATPGSRAAVIGASFIGLEVAASLRQRDVDVAVIAPDNVPLAAILGEDVGRMIRAVHEEKGVRFHLGREVAAFEDGAVRLDDGSACPADIVVLGLGVSPRVALAREAGLAVAPDGEGGGVIVNERLETSVAGIYAVGDIARYPDARLGRPLRVEHWVHAQRQGQHVARVLMRAAGRFADVPFFWSAHFDTGLRYLGHADGGAEAVVEGSIEDREFVIRYRADGRDVAVATCNRDPVALSADAGWSRETRAV